LNSDDISSPEPDIQVETTEGYGSQRYYKKAVCMYCMEQFTKLVPHLERAHNHQKEVQEMSALPRNSIQRKKKCLLIQNRGNFKHNIKVLKELKGTLKVVRRPKDGSSNYKVT